MSAPIAAASTTTQSLTFDFAKPAAPAGGEAAKFASKLLDARQKLPAKPATHHEEDAAPRVDDPQPVEKPSRVDEAAPAADSADVEADRATEETGSSEKPRDDEEKTDGSADAMLAALAAMASGPAPVAAPPEAADVDATPEGDESATAVANVAAAGVAIGAPDAALGTELAGGATADAAPADPAAANPQAANAVPQKPAKDGNAKLDAAVAKMDATDETAAALPADAVAPKSGANNGDQPTGGDADADANAEKAADAAPGASVAKPDDKASAFKELLEKFAPADNAAMQQPTNDAKTAHATPAATATPVRPEQQFAHDNVDRIVSSVQTQAAAGGNGSMRVRLDPPEIGALDVALKMVEGKMTASFTTSNDQATQLLSHSLNQLKGALETAGITVDRLEVRQAAPTTASSDRDGGGQQQNPSDRGFNSSQQQGEQQRKQMVDRLWRKYAYGSDAVDLVA